MVKNYLMLFINGGKKLGNNYGSFSQVHPKGSFFNTHKCNPFLPLNTITSTNGAKLIIIKNLMNYQMKF